MNNSIYSSVQALAAPGVEPLKTEIGVKDPTVDDAERIIASNTSLVTSLHSEEPITVDDDFDDDDYTPLDVAKEQR